MPDPVHVSVHTALPLARAFDRFTRELRDWWPHEYTWSGSTLHDIGIEPHVDGLCYEIGPHGFRCDWGRVLEWNAPTGLRLLWQISGRREPVPDPSRCSIVQVTFAADGTGRTSVALVHEGFERHGPEGQAYRDAMASPQGWPLILARFAAAAP